MTTMSVENRAMAAFLGFAIGDALGATVEFMTRSEIAIRHGVHRELKGGGWLKLKPGQVTDDTQMSLALGRSIIRRGEFNAQDVCDEFVVWLKSGPADVDSTCRREIRRYLLNGAVEGAFSEGDTGNGAAMRVLPVALATIGKPEKAEQWSLSQTHITHHHPLSDAACLALVSMVQSLLGGQGKEEVRAIAGSLAQQYEAFRFEPYAGASSTFIGDTIQTVLNFYLGANLFSDCVIRTVNQGGDADTAGALGGMLAGATYGLAAIPTRWLSKLDRNVVAAIRWQVPLLLAISRRQALRG